MLHQLSLSVNPSLGTIDDCPFEKIPDDQKYEELSEEILEGVLEETKDSGEKVLFIMGDVVNEVKKEMRLEKLLCSISCAANAATTSSRYLSGTRYSSA